MGDGNHHARERQPSPQNKQIKDNICLRKVFMEEVLKTVSINRLWHLMNYTFWEDLNVVSMLSSMGALILMSHSLQSYSGNST